MTSVPISCARRTRNAAPASTTLSAVPLNVSDVTQRHMVSDAVVEACVEAGLPRNADVNGADQEGVTYYQLTVRGGQRCSAAVAYLHPALSRANLRVETRALDNSRDSSRARPRSASSIAKAAS